MAMRPMVSFLTNSIFVSVGDIVDRGEHSKFIFDSFRKLAVQAAKAGGEVINILGNHELMNMQDDLRYVGPSELTDRGDFHGQSKRKQMFSKHGVIGSDLRSRFLPATVRDGVLFSHAGILPNVLQQFS